MTQEFYSSILSALEEGKALALICLAEADHKENNKIDTYKSFHDYSKRAGFDLEFIDYWATYYGLK
jgi:hypothetical protein